MHLTTKLEQELDFPQPVRIHWTGCPNSCGQAQVADIGLMGAPAKKDGKAVEGVRIFTGGKVGENPELAKQLVAGVPLDEEDIIPKLKEVLIEQFGAKEKPPVRVGGGLVGALGSVAAAVLNLLGRSGGV